MKTIVFGILALALLGCGPGEQKAPIENGVHKTYYYKDGPVRMEQTYKNGRLNGTSTTFYKNGATKTETAYVNGQMEGIMRRYNTKGQLAAEAVFKNGVMVSEKRFTKEQPET